MNEFHSYKRPASKQPIPDNAKLVFKGTVYSVYQWDQKMYDGSTKVFEKVARADSAMVIPVLPNGKIILAKQEQPGVVPFIGALGGRLDPGETPLQCASRELMEEAGMEAGEFCEWYAVQPTGMVEWSDFGFIAKNAKVVCPPNLDSGEKIELLEVSFEEFLTIAVKDNFRDKEIKLRVFASLQDEQKKESLRLLFYS